MRMEFVLKAHQAFCSFLEQYHAFTHNSATRSNALERPVEIPVERVRCEQVALV